MASPDEDLTAQPSGDQQPLELLREDFMPELVPANVKLTIKDNDGGSADLWKLPPHVLEIIPGFNIRVRTRAFEEGIRTLAQSMLEEGFYQDKPLTGYAVKVGGVNRVVITDGHRRLLAVRLAISMGAQIDTVPVVLHPKGDNPTDATVRLMTTATAVPLTLYERSVGIKRLSSFGLEPAEISRRLSMRLKDVNELLEFAALPDSLKQMVAAETVSFHHALTVYRANGNKAVALIADAAQKVAASAPAGRSLRVRPQHMPGAARDKAIKKHSSQLYATLEQVTADPAFANLSDPVRLAIAAMIDKVRDAEQKATAPADANADAGASQAPDTDDADGSSGSAHSTPAA